MRAYPPNTKALVCTFRHQGYTYREIRQKLNLDIPKGTMSYWVRNIEMSPDYYLRVKSMANGNIWKAQLQNKIALEKRLSCLREKNMHLVKYINRDIGKIILATLYWCEGTKYPSHRNIRFGNSDPGMITLFLTLIRSCYKLDESKFRLTIQCRADQQTIFLSEFWGQVTQIPYSQHYQPRIDRRSIGKPTTKLKYKGVCVVEYIDANLLCELQYLGEFLGTNKAIEQMKNQIK